MSGAVGMAHSSSIASQNIYQIEVRGQLDDSWWVWIGKVDVRTEQRDPLEPATISITLSTDQAGLVGLIRRLHGMGVVILSVRLQDLTGSQNETNHAET